MLRLTEIELWPQKDIRLYSSSGSVMHGALMDCVDEVTAAMLHTESLRPYSQYVWFDKARGCSIWRIGTVTDEAYELIVQPIWNCTELYLKQKQTQVALKHHVLIEHTTFEDIADTMFAGKEAPTGCDISFLTTTSFKHDHRYDIFPEIRRVFYSLILRWNQYADAIVLDQEGLEDILAQSCRITKYELRSQPFSLEHTSIYGFGGTLRLRFLGNDMTRRLMGLLLSLAPYTGIGVKTAMGMGAVQMHLQYAK